MHKQYIKKRGKVYGPYYYESYRDNSKVRKRYLGKLGKTIKEKKNSKIKVFYPFLFFAFLFLSLASAENPSLGMRISILPSEKVGYGTQSVVRAQEDNINDANCVYNLHRNGALVQNPDIQLLEPGTYHYVYNTTGCDNYASGRIVKDLTVLKLPSKVKLYLGNSTKNISVMGRANIEVKAELENLTGDILVYIDDEIIYNGPSPSYNLALFDARGSREVKAYYPGDSHNKETSEKLFVFVDMPDLEVPNIQLINPKKNDNLSQIVDFSYIVNDRSEIKNCTLMINNRTMYISYSVTKGIENFFSISYLSPGVYSWKIFCVDEKGNKGNSESRKLTIVTVIYSEGGEGVSIGSLGDLLIIRPYETNDSCVERWLCEEWSKCLNDARTRNCVDLNSCGAEKDKPTTKAPCDFTQPDLKFSPPFFNLTVREMDVLNFRIKISEVERMNSSIIIQWFLNSTLIKQNFGIGGLDSNLDIEIFNDSVVMAKILSDYYKEVLIWNIEAIETDCEEKWRCKWTDCKLDGYSYAYDCFDMNNCSTTSKMPFQEKCDCVPTWYCYNWSKCVVRHELKDLLAANPVLKGEHKRLCKDLAKCTQNKIEEKSCSVEVPIEIKEIAWCNETYIEIYSENKTVGRVKQKKIHDLRLLDITFTMSSFRGYCDYCYDNTKDYDEEAVDCGGSCKSCEKPLTLGERSRFNFLGLLNILFLVFLISTMLYILYLRAISFWILFKKYKIKNF